MTTVSGLANLHCSTPNTSSGRPPIRREDFNVHRGKQFSAALQAAGDKRRARQARAKALTRIRA